LLTVRWQADLAGTDVAGWVLLTISDDTTEVVEVSRDPATRELATSITDLDAIYRVEGRSSAGDVIFVSFEFAADQGQPPR